MINFVPIFPLNIVVYPGEPLNLHIFEPRYIQLIKECIKENKQFGIPSVVEKTMEQYGTTMEVFELAKEFETGEMDIRTRGVSVFRVLEVVREIPDKLYSGAIVDYPPNVLELGESDLSKLIMEEVQRFYQLINVEKQFPVNKTSMISYEIAHFIGLSRAQEYELLSIFTEIQRLEYIRKHLKAIIPFAMELEKVKERIRMNGHFRNLSLEE
jgi:Lon protease-like protein